MAMRIPVRQLNGKVTILEVMPETTVGELRSRVKGWQAFDDELMLSRVDLVLGERKLVDEDTMTQDSVTEIERDAFKGCSSLELLTMPAKLVTLGRGAFQGSSLQHLAIPSFVDMIWPLTFDSCKSLLSVTLGHSVGLIEPEAFSSCSLLESLALSAAVCYIGQRAFRGCSSLRSVTIEQTAPPPIQELRAVNARRRCVPNRVRIIEREAFLGCSALRTVTIPLAVWKIEADAFAGCPALETVYLMSCVTQIEEGAFDGNPQIEGKRYVAFLPGTR
ncbi:unnamed protein product [Effrenium voratum]|uniref:Ubiquitin-like domain-containing protein n=1 Tax=Effrenium voratum TaxID=2562239 RepID=A0AA36HPU9_9DINO|nr:unnamed protein product [Effrenium voratum]